MGYEIRKLWCHFEIGRSNLELVLQMIRSLDQGRNPIGEYPGGVESHLAGDLVEKVRAAFRHFDWDPRFDKHGNIFSIDHIGINLGWSEELFRTLAPCVESGSFIELVGEDQAAWKWKFSEGSMIRVNGTLTFDDDEEEDPDISR